MLTTIKGVFDHGEIILQETPPTTETVEVLVTFTEKIHPGIKKKLEFGYGKGTFSYISEDFNEPLEDLKDYM